MNENVKYNVTIETKDNDEKMKLGDSIHNQLVGNQDYVDSNIVLNIDADRQVRLWIFDECENVPAITLF